MASFKEKPNAEEKTQALKGEGCKAFFVEEKAAGEMWYRVYIGRFSSEKTARKRGAELRDRGIISYFKPLIVDKEALFAEEDRSPDQGHDADEPGD